MRAHRGPAGADDGREGGCVVRRGAADRDLRLDGARRRTGVEHERDASLRRLQATSGEPVRQRRGPVERCEAHGRIAIEGAQEPEPDVEQALDTGIVSREPFEVVGVGRRGVRREGERASEVTIRSPAVRSAQPLVVDDA